MNAVCTLLIVVAMWIPPVLTIAANQAKPSIGTALGVPYAFLAGLVLGAVTTAILAVASRRWAVVRPNYFVVAGAALLNLVLFLFADRGMLSVVH